ncbi:hypothetical protein D0809_16255 [Flavobacterium circumlabens]|uniref:Lipoprotein n=1 Tax=Flavobacterium circumlabens TaxID=2133765 RepID=A0A4Y7UB34_9FLAO|nr:hypothetical protein [Flavobacterium circumlabens]TCN55607.1 hypothetical protein EV142_106298 [Flavobacterium circumlabens]TEB42992.1 hypothetical protein D0809_16255 [Flavobacterium circumlabens]
MKITTSIFIILFFFGCQKSYEKEEVKAIEDITNDYLKKNHLDKYYLNPPDFFGKPTPKANIDKLDFKVYLSDALMPINQIREDNKWMFKNNDFIKSDSIIFYGIMNSKKFKDLEYREYDKSKIKLIKPYKQFNEDAKPEDDYSKILFSRVCFDEKMENGIVVINYLIGNESGYTNGYNMALLIKKKNNKWSYVSIK